MKDRRFFSRVYYVVDKSFFLISCQKNLYQLTTCWNVANCIRFFTSTTNTIKNSILVILDKCIDQCLGITVWHSAKAFTISIRHVTTCHFTSWYQNIFTFTWCSASLCEGLTYILRIVWNTIFPNSKSVLLILVWVHLRTVALVLVLIQKVSYLFGSILAENFFVV